jgi:hypothetical protein
MPFSLYFNYIYPGVRDSGFDTHYIEISNIPGDISTTTFESIGSITNPDGSKPVIKFFIKKFNSYFELLGQFTINQTEVYLPYVTFRETFSTEQMPGSGFTKSFDLYADNLFEVLTNTATATPISSPSFQNVSGWTVLANPTYPLPESPYAYAGIEDYRNNGVWEVDLPWFINYSGYSHNRLWISTRGFLSFENNIYRTTTSNPTGALFSTNTIVVCGSNTFLGTDLVYNCLQVQYVTIGSAPNRRFVVRYVGQIRKSNVLVWQDFRWEIVFYESDKTKFDIIVDPNNTGRQFDTYRCYSRDNTPYADLTPPSTTSITGTAIVRNRRSCNDILTYVNSAGTTVNYYYGNTSKLAVAYNYNEQRPITFTYANNDQQFYYSGGQFGIYTSPPV